MTDVNAREVQAEVVIRNTFLSVDVARQSEPRSASVPASMRIAGYANGGGSKNTSPRSEYWGETSTEEGCSVAAEVSTEASEGGDSLSVDLEQAPHGGPPAWKTGVVLAKMLSDQGALNAMLADEKDLLSAVPQPAIPPPPTSSTAPPPRVRLSSTAKAWVPTAPTALGAHRPDELQGQLFTLLMAVKAALIRADGVEAVEASNGSLGWCLAARLAAKEVHRKEQLFGLAKEALLQAAADSQSIYVLGYRWRPFTATPLGFSAVVGCVRDPNQACWGLLKSGSCRDGGRCRWEHPICQVTLNIMVKISEATPPTPPVPAPVAPAADAEAAVSRGADAASQAGPCTGSRAGKTRLTLSVLCA